MATTTTTTTKKPKDPKAAAALKNTTATAAPPNTPAVQATGTTVPAGTRTFPAAQAAVTGTIPDDVINHDLTARGENYETDPIARRATHTGSATYQPIFHFPGQNQEMEQVPVVGSDVSTVQAERQKLYQMGRDELIGLQAKLARAGFYGNADKDGHFGYTPGARDDNTVQAYSDWLVISAREYKARKVNADDVLDEMGAEHDRSGDLLAAQKAPKAPTGSPGATRVMQVDLTDPHELSRLGDQFGQAVLGRDLTLAEKDQLQSLIHARELGKGQVMLNAQQAAANKTAEAAAAFNASPNNSVEADTITPTVTTDVDPQGLISDALRTMHPGEAGAHNYADGINTALSFIRTGGSR